MEKIEFYVYGFTELNEKAQKTAINKKRREIMRSQTEVESRDFKNSLAEFSKIINIEVNYGVDYSKFHFDFSFNDPCAFEWADKNGIGAQIEIDDLRGKLLFRYLNREILPKIVERKYYGNVFFKNGERVLKKRLSNIFVETCCVLTGVYTDNYLIEPIWNFMEKPENISYEQLIKKCLDSFFKVWDEIFHYWDEDKNVFDFLSSQDTLYYENGEIYNSHNL